MQNLKTHDLVIHHATICDLLSSHRAIRFGGVTFKGMKLWPTLGNRVAIALPRIRFWRSLVCGLLCAVLLLALHPSSAWASVNDDRYDGNIFPLYAGNGSIVPPRTTLQGSLERSDRPTVLGFYVDDSKDCKQYSAVWSAVDAYYGRVADLIFLSVDSIPPQEDYAPDEPGYYYHGIVPQTIIFNQSGELVLDESGDTPFETLDDTLREVFDLLPRSESEELRRRTVNEQNLELVPEASE